MWQRRKFDLLIVAIIEQEVGSILKTSFPVWAPTLIVVAVVHLGLMGCEGRRPALSVSVCLESADNIPEFKDEMRTLSEEWNLEFVDDSRSTEQGIREIEDAGLAGDIDAAAVRVQLSAHDHTGLGFSASNLGLSSKQVAIGFARSREDERVRQLSEDVVSTLAERWDVEVAPEGSGVVASEQCGQ